MSPERNVTYVSSRAFVQPGHIGNRTFSRHGLQPRAERVADCLQGILFQIDVSEAISQSACAPSFVVHLLSAGCLSSECERARNSLLRGGRRRMQGGDKPRIRSEHR